MRNDSTTWQIIERLGGWALVAVLVVYGGRFLGRWFERALIGFETALRTNQQTLAKLGEAVDRAARMEAEETEMHARIVETQVHLRGTQEEIIKMLKENGQ